LLYSLPFMIFKFRDHSRTGSLNLIFLDQIHNIHRLSIVCLAELLVREMRATRIIFIADPASPVPDFCCCGAIGAVHCPHNPKDIEARWQTGLRRSPLRAPPYFPYVVVSGLSSSVIAVLALAAVAAQRLQKVTGHPLRDHPAQLLVLLGQLPADHGGAVG